MYNGSITANAVTPSVNMKNRIINGAMVIDQRNAGASVTVNSTTQTFSVDRWWASGQATDGVFTMQQSSVSPTGFSNSLISTVTTADSSIGATQRYYIAQRIEGFNTADLGWGTANARTVTLSFWVRSSVTGTFGGFIYNSAADYSYPFTYTINAANTWEFETITIVGPTAGTWLGATNGVGMQIGWSLGAGSTVSGTAGSWAASQFFGATGQTNIIATNGATFYITGVQLEVGSTATSFDYRPYGTELALCQRYYFKIFPADTNSNLATGYVNSSTTASLTGNYPVVLRVAPTALEQSGTAGNYRIVSPVGSADCSSVPTFATNTNQYQYGVTFTVASGLTTGYGATGRTGSTTGASAYLAWSAEL
jgi:hypothetical protein